MNRPPGWPSVLEAVSKTDVKPAWEWVWSVVWSSWSMSLTVPWAPRTTARWGGWLRLKYKATFLSSKAVGRLGNLWHSQTVFLSFWHLRAIDSVCIFEMDPSSSEVSACCDGSKGVRCYNRNVTKGRQPWVRNPAFRYLKRLVNQSICSLLDILKSEGILRFYRF